MSAGTSKKVQSFRGNKLILFMIVVLLLIGWSVGKIGNWQGRNPVESAARIKIAAVPLSEQWSATVEIPPGRCFWINAPGWLEYKFSGGERYQVRSGEQKKFPGVLPSRFFRLRGESGTAEVYLVPCRN